MDNELKWIVIATLGSFAILFGGIFFSDYLTHMERQECIKVRGDWSDKACHFPK